MYLRALLWIIWAGRDLSVLNSSLLPTSFLRGNLCRHGSFIAPPRLIGPLGASEGGGGKLTIKKCCDYSVGNCCANGGLISTRWCSSYLQGVMQGGRAAQDATCDSARTAGCSCSCCSYLWRVDSTKIVVVSSRCLAVTNWEERDLDAFCCRFIVMICARCAKCSLHRRQAPGVIPLSHRVIRERTRLYGMNRFDERMHPVVPYHTR